jgi:hypothetical protein
MKSTRKEMLKTTDHTPGTSRQATHPKPTPSYPTTQPMATSQKVGKARSNTSIIIAMLNPCRHIFRDWTPLPFSVHEDDGLEVGKEIIRKIAEALGHPMPAAPSNETPAYYHTMDTTLTRFSPAHQQPRPPTHQPDRKQN